MSLADYLDNSQIAQRASSHTIAYLAQHRWAGSLEEMVADVIADEINVNHPGYKATILERGREELVLDVRVMRFDFQPEIGISLQLEYNVMEADSGESLRQERISLQQSLPADAAVGAVVNSMEVVLRNAVNQIRLK